MTLLSMWKGSSSVKFATRGIAYLIMNGAGYQFVW